MVVVVVEAAAGGRGGRRPVVVRCCWSADQAAGRAVVEAVGATRARRPQRRRSGRWRSIFGRGERGGGDLDWEGGEGVVRQEEQEARGVGLAGAGVFMSCL